MTEYKATPEQWAELRARVEALEANSKPTPNNRQIRSSLVERVQHVIYNEYARSKTVGCPEARAAILEVAAWVEETQHDHWSAVSRILRFELKQETEQ